jgi:hypothetical protein
MNGYPGQGKDIPSQMGRGAWIHEPFLFLSLDDETTAEGDVHIGGLVPTASGTNAVGIGAKRVAKLMVVTVAELMDGNKRGALQVANKVVSPAPGIDRAMRFQFRLGERRAELTVGLTAISRT